MYHVLLTRTPEGWRFKENWYVGAGATVQDGAKRFVPGGGQAPAAAGAPSAPAVTRDKMQALTVNAEDDAAIRQLYARFSHAIDSGAENGAALARVFTADGIFLDTWTNKVYAGSEQLAALARETSKGKGPTSLNQFIWTVKLEAAPQGASAKGYMMTGTPQEPGTPIVMTNGGQYLGRAGESQRWLAHQEADVLPLVADAATRADGGELSAWNVDHEIDGRRRGGRDAARSGSRTCSDCRLVERPQDVLGEWARDAGAEPSA